MWLNGMFEEIKDLNIFNYSENSKKEVGVPKGIHLY